MDGLRVTNTTLYYYPQEQLGKLRINITPKIVLPGNLMDSYTEFVHSNEILEAHGSVEKNT